VVLVVADDATDAKAAAKEKWHGAGRGHVDAVVLVDTVDGYRVNLTRGGEGDRATLDSVD
jgi:hypothetical protein